MPWVEPPPVKAKPAVDLEVLASVHPEWWDDAFVRVHCHFDNKSQGMLVRIWATTFLIDVHSSAQAELVHAENISFAPQWTLIPDFQPYQFLLIFSALPKACTMFDLVENIPQPGGFLVRGIPRNQSDVYHVNI